MDTVVNSLVGLKIKESIRDDDSIDQLHHFVTVYLLAAFAILIGVKEYTVGQLDCWVTANLTLKHYQDHANTYCWTHKLYRYPNPDNLSQVPYEIVPGMGGPANSTILESENSGEINFYRWVTVLFLCQAFMFKLPNLLWSECNEYSGTQIEKMVTMIGSSSFDTNEKKNTTFGNLAEFLEVWLKINRKPFWFMKSRVGRQTKKVLQNWMICVGANTGNFLSTMYLVTKAMFLLNVFLQFFILSAFLHFSYWAFGVRALQNYASSDENVDNVHFPRVALCHFQVRGEGRWIQCLLTINMLLEKLFIIEWFWLLFLLVLTLYSLAAWLIRILRTERSVKFVTRYLSVFNDDGTLPQEGKRTVLTFVRDYLGNDGVFILRIIATNTNDVIMSELVCNVWKRYIEYRNIAIRPDSVSKEVAPAGDSTENELDRPPLPAENDKIEKDKTQLHIG